MIFKLIFILISSATVKSCIDKNQKKYDFIVVGGGSAGAVIANRLSELKRMNVLLLEAGGKPPKLSQIPSLFFQLQNTAVDWSFSTVSQKHAFYGTIDQRSKWPRGKMLGGSSSINGLIYARGNKLDYDHWDKEGAKGWNWKNIFPYFLKLENSNLVQEDRDYHHKGGAFSVTSTEFKNPSDVAFNLAVQKLGYKFVDYNGENQTGVGLLQASIYKGRRESTYTAYLKPVKCRCNLKILTFATAEKVIFDKNKKAVAVIYTNDGNSFKAEADKEIILSAGAIKTPQLLILSGIGPKEHLNALNIKVISDLPVGCNLQDHISLFGPLFVKDENDSKFKVNVNDFIAEHFITGKSPLSELNYSMAFLNSKNSSSKEWPDIQIIKIYYPFTEYSVKLIQKNWGFSNKIMQTYIYPLIGKEVLIFLPILLRPKSRGKIKVKSKNSFEDPLIDPQYLSEREDVDLLIEAAEISYKIGTSQEFVKCGYKPAKTTLPNCNSFNYATKKYWECLVKTMTISLHHAVGTSKMGSRTNRHSVLDDELNVIGVSSLRVVDASIMPNITSANTNAVVIMIAEKASDLIKKSYI